MNIAIQAADLDAKRIDGTRVYIKELLNRFGDISPDDAFFLYHRGEFNPELQPRVFSNYIDRKIQAPCMWTQTRFAYELWRERLDRLWMPMQAIPLIRPSKLKTIVTIHDLAFKIFPDHFPSSDRRRLEILTYLAILKSDRIIAVSENTKKDILRYYPNISEKKIKVIHHGYTSAKNEESRIENRKTLENYKLQSKGYILYVGALQPRKNIRTLIKAFDKLKKESKYKELKLVLAGERAWLWGGIEREIQKNKSKKDIIITGTIPFESIQVLYKNASVFVFPSLYEGFGLPVLEAFASDVPVVCANNSSLPEVAGDAALYFDAYSTDELSRQIQVILERNSVKKEMIYKGNQQLKNFSWDTCARETLNWIRE